MIFNNFQTFGVYPKAAKTFNGIICKNPLFIGFKYTFYDSFIRVTNIALLVVPLWHHHAKSPKLYVFLNPGTQTDIARLP